jgi:hypothetical protein
MVNQFVRCRPQTRISVNNNYIYPRAFIESIRSILCADTFCVGLVTDRVFEQVNIKPSLLADFNKLAVEILEKALKKMLIVIERSRTKIGVYMKVFGFSPVPQDFRMSPEPVHVISI